MRTRARRSRSGRRSSSSSSRVRRYLSIQLTTGTQLRMCEQSTILKRFCFPLSPPLS
eukprot:COSAG05_NODE_10226_length_576_cov_384.668763_1_plen_56_part_01